MRACTFLVTAAEPGPDIATMIRTRLSSPGHDPRLETQAVSPESLLSLVSGNRVAVTFGVRPCSGQHGAPVFRVPHDAFGPTRLEQGVHWKAGNRRQALVSFLDHLAGTFGRDGRNPETEDLCPIQGAPSRHDRHGGRSVARDQIQSCRQPMR